ncbi:hypothetical protein MMC27_001494 [Xylographa pallens]|nr:hypothetical protein [Xylographa pallens]
MAFLPNGSTPDLSWQLHVWETMQGAAAEDGPVNAGSSITGDGPFTETLWGCVDTSGFYQPTSHNQLSSIANHYYSKGDCVDFENNLTKHTTTWTHHPLSTNDNGTHNDGSAAYRQRPEDSFADDGKRHKNNVLTDRYQNQYRPFESSPSTVLAGQSQDSYCIPGLGTHLMDISMSYDQHIGDSAPPMVFPAMAGSATVTESTPLVARQSSVDNSSRFPCLHPGCVQTFGRTADLDRHYKKHVPYAAKFSCYEIGCKYNGKPFYRRDKLLSDSAMN